MGSVLTNKYSEGYPAKRYYGGNMVIDDVEAIAIERAKSLFGAEHANVQPHSGANANMSAYQALLQPGDTVLGLSLDHGGHLTHGSPVNASGLTYRFVAYKVKPGDERIDMDQVRDLALEHRPKMIVAGTTSYPRRLEPEPFRSHRRRGRRAVAVRRRPPRRARRRWRPSRSCAVLRRRHADDAQDARVARGGTILCREEHAKAIDKAVFPAGRVGRSSTSSPPRRSPSGRRPIRRSVLRPRKSSPTPRRWPRHWRGRGSAWCRAARTTT